MTNSEAVKIAIHHVRPFTELKAELRRKAKWCKKTRIQGWEKYDDLHNCLLAITNLIHGRAKDGLFSEKRRDQYLKWMFDYFKKQWAYVDGALPEREASFRATWKEVVDNKW